MAKSSESANTSLVKLPGATSLAKPSGLAPVTRLSEVTLACAADEPLRPEDPRWLDLGAGRGDRSVQHLRRRLEEKPPGTFLPLAFMSHRGAGKTTELLRLQSALAHRYVSLYLEANVEMDPFKIEAEDLFLVLARRRRQRMRDLINASGYWPTLVRVAQDKQVFEDGACMEVLFHRLVLKYNGEVWYDVQPLVAEMPEFRRAYKPPVIGAG